MKALIDGDIPSYSVGFACEGTFYLCGDGAEFKYKKDAIAHCENAGLDVLNIEKMTNPEPIENCLHSVKVLLGTIIEKSGADEHQIYLTGKGNFREEIATILPYKGNRTAPKPFHYENIRDYLINIQNAEVVDGMEADDMLGIEQYKVFKEAPDYHPEATKDQQETIICSIDKDLDMIPGWHYNWNKDEKYYIDEKQGMRNFYMQLLTGDKTDNIQGIVGIGTKKAEKILAPHTKEEDMYLAVFETYSDYYSALSVSEVTTIIKENADLLWIARELDEEGNPVRWQPPTLTWEDHGKEDTALRALS